MEECLYLCPRLPTSFSLLVPPILVIELLRSYCTGVKLNGFVTVCPMVLLSMLPNPPSVEAVCGVLGLYIVPDGLKPPLMLNVALSGDSIEAVESVLPVSGPNPTYCASAALRAGLSLIPVLKS